MVPFGPDLAGVGLILPDISNGFIVQGKPELNPELSTLRWPQYVQPISASTPVDPDRHQISIPVFVQRFVYLNVDDLAITINNDRNPNPGNIRFKTCPHTYLPTRTNGRKPPSPRPRTDDALVHNNLQITGARPPIRKNMANHHPEPLPPVPSSAPRHPSTISPAPSIIKRRTLPAVAVPRHSPFPPNTCAKRTPARQPRPNRPRMQRHLRTLLHNARLRLRLLHPRTRK